jgi:ankyrin repeat protein
LIREFALPFWFVSGEGVGVASLVISCPCPVGSFFLKKNEPRCSCGLLFGLTYEYLLVYISANSVSQRAIMKPMSCVCSGRPSSEMDAPIPVPHTGEFKVESTRPRGLVRKSSRLQTHVEVLRCRMGKPTAKPETDRSLGPSKEWTPIYYAVFHQREAALKHFLRTGGSPDDVDGTGQPPLCIAVANGYVEMVKILLDAGANVDAITKDTGETALHIAIKNNRTDIIDMLLEAGPKLEVYTTETKETPLHYAASKSGSLATIVTLLKLGAKYDTLNSRSQSPAEAALLANNIQGAVAIINAAHGRRNKLAKEKEMLLKRVERSQNRFSIGNELIADIFSAACDPDSTVLIEAIKRDDAGLVEMFLGKGADPDRETARGERPIFIALECAGAPVVQVLVKHKADVTARDARGFTVLQAAFEGPLAQDKESISAIFDCMLSSGASATVTYPDGKTLLHRAVSPSFDYPRVAHLLLKSGVQADTPDNDGNTALHLATHSKLCVDVLLKNGANPHRTNQDGLTPLLYAISRGKRSEEPDLEALMKVSDLRKTNLKKQTALHLAASNGLEKIIRILLRARVDTATVDSSKHTPLLLAVSNHQWHVVPLLTIPPSINSWNEDGMTALHQIAMSIPKAPSSWQDIATAAVPFCERGVSRSMRDRTGATPLILAIKTLPEEGLLVVETLLMQKADKSTSWNCVSHEDHGGRDAFYYATTLRKVAFVEALLKHGATFTFKDWASKIGELSPSKDANTQIMKLLAQSEWSRRAGALRRQSVGPESESQESPFATMFAIKDLKSMISMGLDPNALPKTMLGSSLLWAILRQIPLQPPLPPKYLFDTIKLILECRADPNVGTARGVKRTPSPQASSQDLPLSLHTLTFLLEEYPTVDVDLVTLLLTKGTKLSLASPFYGGRYPLHSATKANRIDIVDEFLLQRADVNCIDHEGRTPLFVAAEKGFWEIADTLLRRGAKVDLKDNEGNTVLHAAAIGGSKRIVAILLRAGATANVKNKKDIVPLACVPEQLETKEKDKIVHMLKDSEEKGRRDEELNRKLLEQNAAHEAIMKQRQEKDAKDKLRREQETKEQQQKKIEKPRQVSSPIPEKPASKRSIFRTSSLLSPRPKIQPPPPSSMPKLEVSIRITTPPSSKQLSPNTTTSSTAKLPTITTTSASSTNPRIDSGFGQKRPSDTEKPLPVLDRTKETLEEKAGDKRNSSAAELADWLALTKMMDNM